MPGPNPIAAIAARGGRARRRGGAAGGAGAVAPARGAAARSNSPVARSNGAVARSNSPVARSNGAVARSDGGVARSTGAAARPNGAPAPAAGALAPRARPHAGHPAATSRTGALTRVAVGLGLMIVTLDATIVSVATPAIGGHLGASVSRLEWVTDAYLLALAVGVIAGGKLGDQFGPKRLFLTGTAGFALASLGCGLSGSVDVLIAFRVAQGLFGAMVLAQGLAIVGGTVPFERLAGTVGSWGLAVSTVAASGPIIGGLLVDYLGWRSIFILSLPVAALALLGGWMIRESREATAERTLDWTGIALLSLALFTLGWGLIVAERRGFDHAHAFSFLLTVLLLLALFAGWEQREQRAGRPHLPLGLLRSRKLSAGVAIELTVFLVLFAVVFYVALYLQRVQGYTATQAGVRLLALAGALGLGALLAGRARGWLGPRVALLAGVLAIAGGLLGLSQLEPRSSYDAIWPFLVLVGLGIGSLQLGASRAAITAGATSGEARIGGGLHAAALQVGGLLGLTVLGSVIATRVTSTLPGKLAAAGVPRHLAGRLVASADSVAQGVVPIPRGASASTVHAITSGSLGAFTTGLDTAMVVGAVFALIAGAAALLLVPRARAQGAAPPTRS